jgi:hypothetical protein
MAIVNIRAAVDALRLDGIVEEAAVDEQVGLRAAKDLH